MIRKDLIRNRIHHKAINMERLFLPRLELGIGIISAEFRSKLMLLQLRDMLKNTKEIFTGIAAILQVEVNSYSHHALERSFSEKKYNCDLECLKDVQKTSLYSKQNNKNMHSKLYNCIDDKLFNVKDSAVWFTRGNNGQGMKLLCFLQDGNILYGFYRKMSSF